MRHRRKTQKLNRTTSHRRCMFANMLKSLVDKERIVTSPAKAKALRSFADKLITMAKENTLASRRRAIGTLMIQFNELSPKEQRAAKNGDTSSYNTDRRIIQKLFSELGPRFAIRKGGYTRILRLAERRVGDNAEKCIIEYLSE